MKNKAQHPEEDISTIHLSQYEVAMFLGIHPYEKNSMQRVLISAEVTYVERGIFWDYDALQVFLEKEVSGQHIDTQEELIRKIISWLKANCHNLVHCKISTRKPDVFSKALFVGVSKQYETGN